MRTLGIIPARAGSKRLSRKNLRVLGGRPLVTWAIDAALAARRLDHLVVSTDDDEVLAIAATYSSELGLRRPTELATDTAPAIAYVHHALRALEGESDRFTAIVIVQPTSPLTTGADIDATVELLYRSGADSAVSVVALDHALQPAKIKALDGDRLIPYMEAENGRMAAHEFPPLFIRNGSVYAALRHIIESGNIIGEDCRAHIMPRERSIDINEDIDLAFAEFLLQRGATR